MAVSSLFKTFLLIFTEYHLLREFKLVIYSFNILYKSVNKYLCDIIVIVFSRVRYRLLRIYTVVEALYIITKRARRVFLVFISIRRVGIRLACIDRFDKRFKIGVYYKRDSHLSIIIFKTQHSTWFWKFYLLRLVLRTVFVMLSKRFYSCKTV